MSGMLKGRPKNDLHIKYSAADDSNMEFLIRYSAISVIAQINRVNRKRYPVMNCLFSKMESCHR